MLRVKEDSPYPSGAYSGWNVTTTVCNGETHTQLNQPAGVFAVQPETLLITSCDGVTCKDWSIDNSFQWASWVINKFPHLLGKGK